MTFAPQELSIYLYYCTLQADFDNSGTIDYSEFVAAMLNLNKAQKEDHMFAAFTYFDKDGSGYITADELLHACEQFGLEDVHLEGIMREVDQDNVNIFCSFLYKGQKYQIIVLTVSVTFVFSGWPH